MENNVRAEVLLNVVNEIRKIKQDKSMLITNEMYLSTFHRKIAVSDSVDLDSLDLISLFATIENNYGIIIDYDAEIYTIGELVDYVMQNKEERAD